MNNLVRRRGDLDSGGEEGDRSIEWKTTKEAAAAVINSENIFFLQIH